VTALDCILAKKLDKIGIENAIDINHIGYQSPVPKEVKPERTERTDRAPRPHKEEGGNDRGSRTYNEERVKP
jgi:hypothetical protein